jgi:hypothetical protein
MIEGGCFCGKIRYELAEGSHLVVNCHCTMCRKAHAAPYVAWLVAPLESFKYTTKEPSVLHSSSDGDRYFCPDCGSHIACMNHSRPEIIDVTVGSLDHPENAVPQKNVFRSTRLPWVNVAAED